MAPPASKRQARASRGKRRAPPGRPEKRAASARATPSQPWSGRFGEPVSELVQRFTASVSFDQRLALHDIAGLARACAHACRLRHHLRAATAPTSSAAWRRSAREIAAERFAWSLEAEDVHLNIERRLIELVGDAGKRLHTARSRNDQVATDVRLWLRDEIDAIDALLVRLQDALLEQAERHAALVMPGFTHLQVAQPVTFGHHLMAYFEMLERDRERLADCRRRVNLLPLGRRRARRHDLSHRPRARGARARLRRACAPTRSTRCPTATSPSSSARTRRSPWCTCRASPRSWCCG